MKRKLIATILLAFTYLFWSCTGGEKKYQHVITRANTLYDSAGYITARHYIDSVYNIGGAASHYFMLYRYNCLREWSFLIKHTDSSAMYADSMLSYILANRLETRYNDVYTGMMIVKGNFAYERGDLVAAFDYYSRARQITEQVKDQCQFIPQISCLGIITYRQKRYKEAITYFQEVYRATDSCTDDPSSFYKKEEMWMNIGLAYAQMKEYDSAMKYYAASLDYVAQGEKLYPGSMEVKHFMVIAYGVLKGNIAKLYIQKQQPDTAIQLLHESIHANDSFNFDIKDAMYSRMQLAELYFDLDSLIQTKNVLNRMQVTLDTVPVSDIMLRKTHLWWKYYTRINDLAASTKSFERYKFLKDSVDAAEEKMRLTDYSMLLRERDTEHRLAMVKRDAELNRLYLGIFALLSALAGVIILLIYRNYSRERKNIKTLTNLNSQINEQKDALENAISQLQESITAKDRILHIVAHDLRSPISGIMTLNKRMLDRTEDERQQESLRMCINAAGSAMSMINEILDDYSNTSSAKKYTNRINISELVSNAVALARLRAADKDQTITLDVPSDTITVAGDEEKLNRLMANILGNAIKFSPAGAAVNCTISRTADKVHIVVIDNGIGIPEHLQPRIFDQLTPARRSGTNGEVSFGLGLAICRRIAELHNGTINIESIEGRGSSVTITLPALP